MSEVPGESQRASERPQPATPPASNETVVAVETAPEPLIQYLLGTRAVIGDFDSHIQRYEFQVFTTLSILATAGLGIVGLFWGTHPSLPSFLTIGVGVAGLLVDTAYFQRIAFYVRLQAKAMQTTINLEEAIVPHVMRRAGVRGRAEDFMLTHQLQQVRSAPDQYLTVRLTSILFAILFVGLIAVGVSLLI